MSNLITADILTMPKDTPNFLALPGNRRLAYEQIPGRGPGIIFLGGFRSDMTGTKAVALAGWCRRNGQAFIRFDYRGHGQSSGDFADGTVGQWLDDALAILDQLTQGPQVLVGSSMGGWIALLSALARPDRVHGLVTIACATDFTQRLIEPSLSPTQRRELEDQGVTHVPSDYDDLPYPITRHLIEQGNQHRLLEMPIAIDCPVRLIHGLEDADVPWQISLETAQQLISRDVTLTLVKGGDHRLSKPGDLEHCFAQLHTLTGLPQG